MKYCVNYNKNSTILEDVDEINIFLEESKEATILKFMEEHSTQRINICLKIDQLFTSRLNLDLFIAFAKKYPDIDFAFRFDTPDYPQFVESILQKCKDNNIKFYFQSPVRGWDQLHQYFSIGVSDIFIVEEMGFQLDIISSICAEKNIKIRVYPNIAQSSWSELESIKKFFIRPEDTNFYDNYIDVFEFFPSKNVNVLYDIYANDKKWDGDLKDLITDFTDSVNNRNLVRLFAPLRLKCGKQCLKGKSCSVCTQIVNLSNTLDNNHIIIKHMSEELDN